MTRSPRHRRQGGLLLLPVALTLAVVAALAYTMTREGSMNVSSVDAEYEIEAARYLAESGFALARWQNEKKGCGNHVGFGTVALPGGQIVASDADVGAAKINGDGGLSVSLVATSTRGAVRTLSNQLTRMHDRSKIADKTIDGSGGNDTFISDGSANPGGTQYLETTDGKSHALLKFSMPAELKNAVVLKAELKLTQTDSKSSQPVRSLAAHRVTHDWSGGGATWTTPWSAPGGDYAPDPAASVSIAGNAQYVLRIDALVEGWGNGSLRNQGLLLKPTGLLEARFASFESPSNKPQLVVRYLPAC